MHPRIRQQPTVPEHTVNRANPSPTDPAELDLRPATSSTILGPHGHTLHSTRGRTRHSTPAATPSQRPRKPPPRKERPGYRRRTRPPRIGIPRRADIRRTTRPVVPHPVHGQQLRHHTPRTVKIRPHRVPVPARHSTIPHRTRRVSHPTAVPAPQYHVVGPEPLRDDLLSAPVRYRRINIAVDDDDRHHPGPRSHRG